MKIQTREEMIERIKKGRYSIAKIWNDEEKKPEYFICSGKGEKMSFKKVTDERAQEWLDLGANEIYL